MPQPTKAERKAFVLATLTFGDLLSDIQNITPQDNRRKRSYWIYTRSVVGELTHALIRRRRTSSQI